jgi:hypothetical protein
MLQIIYNLLQVNESANEFVNLNNFYFKPFFNIILGSQYPEIQNIALDIICWLTSQPKVPVLSDIFITEGCIPICFEILKVN